MSVDSSGNQKVDFAWGNVPMQPNEDRDGSGALVVEPANSDQNRSWSGTVVYPSQLLNEALDNHLLVATGHNGYPDYLPNDIDAIPGDIPIPDLVGGTVLFATEQWVSAGFNSANITINYIPNAEGATAQNDGVIASQSPEAGHTAGADHVITLNVYQYINPVPPALWTLNFPQTNSSQSWLPLISTFDYDTTWEFQCRFFNADVPTDANGAVNSGFVGRKINFNDTTLPSNWALFNNGQFTVVASSVSENNGETSIRIRFTGPSLIIVNDFSITGSFFNQGNMTITVAQ